MDDTNEKEPLENGSSNVPKRKRETPRQQDQLSLSPDITPQAASTNTGKARRLSPSSTSTHNSASVNITPQHAAILHALPFSPATPQSPSKPATPQARANNVSQPTLSTFPSTTYAKKAAPGTTSPLARTKPAI